MARTNDRDEEAEQQAEYDGRQRDLECDAEALDQIHASGRSIGGLLEEAKVEVVAERVPLHGEPGDEAIARGGFRHRHDLLQLVALDRVVGHPFLEASVGLDGRDCLVDGGKQLGLALRHRDRILLRGEEVGEGELLFALHAVLRGVDVRDHERAAPREHGGAGLGRRFEALGLLLELLHHVGVARRAALHADFLPLEQIRCRVGRRLLEDDDDARLDIRHREVDVFLPILRDRDAGGGKVRLARDHGGDHRVEVHVLDTELAAELLRDGLRNLHIDADDLLSTQEFIRRECRLRGHRQSLSGLRNAGRQNETAKSGQYPLHLGRHHRITCPSACRSLR